MTDSPIPEAGGRGAFRSLRIFNYRLWAAGALVSNIGTWMQRTAQDWLVLTELTDRSASALGILLALQYGPQLLFLPLVGFAADYFDRRKLVMVMQAILGALALILGIMTLLGVIELWHVYVLAFLSGTAAAFDAPARQTFVSDLVSDEDLANAVALNSTSFNAARMLGPAVAGLCIAAWGTGWAFLINGFSFFGVLASLTFIRLSELHSSPRVERARGNLFEGIRYIRSRGDLRSLLVMLFLIGAFSLNFPIFISTMSVSVFDTGAGRYGLLSSMMAVGTTLGALFAATRGKPRFRSIVISTGAFGVALAVAAAMPTYWLFAAVLVPLGMAALMFTNTTNSLMQLATEPSMRGRVIAIRLAVMSGVTFIGAPIVGFVADNAGPRWGMGLGATAALLAALVGVRYLRSEVRDRERATRQGDAREVVQPEDTSA